MSTETAVAVPKDDPYFAVVELVRNRNVPPLSTRQIAVLSAVRHAKSDAERGTLALAKRLNLPGPAIVRAVDALEKLKWVVREPHPEDRRKNIIRIAEKICPLFSEPIAA